MAPIDLFHRLLDRYHKGPEQHKPVISPRMAAFLSILATLVYVVPFYLSPQTRPSPNLSRDSPTVIRARIRAVTCSCLLTSVLTLYVAVYGAKLRPLETLRVLGIFPISFLDIGRTTLLVAILFAGPLFEKVFVQKRWRQWMTLNPLQETLGSWIGWRNYIAGPITEELIWRANIIPLHMFATVSPAYLVFVTPLYFGIAHIHHYYEYRLTHPYTPFLPGILRTLLQFTYTSLFGFFAAFVFLRTGNLLAVIIAHSFCNWMGLPRIWGRVEIPTSIGPPDARGKEDLTPLHVPDSKSSQVANGRLGLAWTIVYYLLLLLGMVGFYRGIWPLTLSNHALVEFNKAK